MDYTLQPKDMTLLSAYESNISIYAVYKRPPSDLGRNTYKLKVKELKKVFHGSGNQK